MRTEHVVALVFAAVVICSVLALNAYGYAMRHDLYRSRGFPSKTVSREYGWPLSYANDSFYVKPPDYFAIGINVLLTSLAAIGLYLLMHNRRHRRPGGSIIFIIAFLACLSWLLIARGIDTRDLHDFRTTHYENLNDYREFDFSQNPAINTLATVLYSLFATLFYASIFYAACWVPLLFNSRKSGRALYCVGISLAIILFIGGFWTLAFVRGVWSYT